MQKLIAEALKEEITRYGIMGMTQKSTYIDYDRLAKAVVDKLEEYDYL
jgi:hypothetical protein